MAPKKNAVKKTAEAKLKSEKKPVKEKKKEVKKVQKEEKAKQEPAPTKPKIERAKTVGETIVKVRLAKEGHLEIEFEKIESDHSQPEGTIAYKKRLVHPDLQQKFNNLRVHLGLMCGYISKQQIKSIDDYNPERVEDFIVRGVTIKSEGYVISGQKKLDNNKRITLNTPFTLMEENEATAYRYLDHLTTCVDELIAETKLYESGEKVGQPVQTSMFPEDARKEDSKSGITEVPFEDATGEGEPSIDDTSGISVSENGEMSIVGEDNSHPNADDFDE